MDENELEYICDECEKAQKISSTDEDREHVKANISFLKAKSFSLEEDYLLKFAVCYPETFSMKPEIFMKRLDLFIDSFQEWEKILVYQIYIYKSFAVLSCVSEIQEMMVTPEGYFPEVWKAIAFNSEEEFLNIIEKMKNPSSINWEFLDIFKECGVHLYSAAVLSKYDIVQILEFEIHGWNFAESTHSLIEGGMNVRTLSEIVLNGLQLLAKGQGGVEILELCFGKNYTKKMNRLETDGKLGECLKKINRVMEILKEEDYRQFLR